MDDNQVNEMFEAMTKPKYGGIDAFFAALTVVVIACLVPITVLAWRAAF